MKIRLGTRDADDILRQFVLNRAVPDRVLSLFNSPLGIDITFEKVKPERTRKQEKYYRKWCETFAKDVGVSPDSMHEIILKECYGTIIFNTKNGFHKIPAKRSADTTRETYSELIETLIRCAAFADFIVPPPEPIDDA